VRGVVPVETVDESVCVDVVELGQTLPAEVVFGRGVGDAVVGGTPAVLGPEGHEVS